MAILNANKQIKKLKTREDLAADKITTFAGSMDFVRIHIAWFALWIVINIGAFGASVVFDKYPFGLLTLIVSLEAIFLSTFVMISQNRQARSAEIRSELDYKVNLTTEQEIRIVLKAVERFAAKHDVDVQDLVSEFNKIAEDTDTKKTKGK